MNPSNGNASGPGRHPSNRISMTMSDATDDEYDLNPMAVSDGFRPSDGPSAAPQPQRSLPFTEPASTASNLPATNQISHLNDEISSKQTDDISRRPSSISKAHRPHDSLTLHNDGAVAAVAGHFNRPSPAEPAAGPGIVRVESPYQGPSGPSHPYNMYPQRTLSNATVSTDAATPTVSQIYEGPTGPTHPYALYTQHTTPVHENTSQQHIPVGFTPMSGSYQRQLGPDGEDAGGLIGPLGHTEELPPYTRYPPEAYSRKDLAQETVTAPAAAPESPITGAGGIGMATRNPEFSSTDEDLARPPSHPSVRSTPSQASQHEINTAAQEIAEKPTLTKWQRRARKKLCGVIPYWAICLLFTFIIITASIMAGVLTTFLNKEDKTIDSEYPDDTGPPAAVEPDPLPSLPPDLAPLAIGSYGLPQLDYSRQESKLCFNDFTQAGAWSCDIPLRTFSMDVSKIPNASETENYELTLAPLDPPNSKYIWGTLPPNVPDPVQLTLVNDTSEQPPRGPAWWLKVTYDKTVIVSENEFSPNSQASKRGWTYADYPAGGFDPSQLKEKSRTAVDGDKPWICTWPRTTLEISIFPAQNSSLAGATTTSTGPPAATSAWSTAYATPGPSSGGPGKSWRPYPRVIKFSERRSTSEDDPPPHCRQVQIFNNGHAERDVLDKDGNPKIVIIREVDRGQSSSGSSKRDLVAMRIRDSQVTECGCIWRST